MRFKKRLYDTILAEHLSRHRQMAFVTGPRQVGKTTTCRAHADFYVNWDNLDDRERILGGPARVVEALGLNRLRERTPAVLFDELHKFPGWRTFLKGFFDTYSGDVRIILTGSSRLDIYRRGGESLMGRYFLYHMHPFSVAEVLERSLPEPDRILRPPKKIGNADFEALLRHGGYPEPFLKREIRFTRRWQSLRMELLFREEIRNLAQVQQIGQLEMLARLLAGRSARQLVFANLAKDVRVSVDTVRRWVDLLCNLHLGFLLRPWFKNVTRSLRKEPKWFLRDWSVVEDPGDRAETFVGCHLLKAVEGWNDLGLGGFEIGYLRDKEKREVDFVVVRDGRPWFLVEVKLREEKVSKALSYFQERLKAPYAFQVILEADYVSADCLQRPGRPLVVPARTFLSQLL